MAVFLYQIKGKDEYGRWQWPPLYCNVITADSSKEARKLIEADYAMKMPGAKLKNEEHAFLCNIDELKDEDYRHGWLNVNICIVCSNQFRVIDKFNASAMSSSSNLYCSNACSASHHKVQYYQDEGIDMEVKGIHKPIIYKITNKISLKCYIGKTTQAFTLRWYQHFFQAKQKTKFYEAIKSTKTSDWTFEVIEIIDVPKEFLSMRQVNEFILERETYYMNLYDSIKNGYNSLPSKGSELSSDDDSNEFQLPLFENHGIEN